jgi:GNAT superfamily N-acetyltransferase
VPAASDVVIRPYQPADRDAVYDVCLRTGDAGGDATGKYPDDDVIPDIYAGPYLYLEPGLAFVADDGARAVGYVIGTTDTERFVRRYREEWLPTMAAKYGPPGDPPASAYDDVLDRLYRPERMLVAELACYPAHLHIDLLPRYQRSGYGRRLIEAFIEAAARAGASGTHVAVAGTNTGAHEFYQRVGFRPVEVTGSAGSAGSGGSVYFGRPNAVDGSAPACTASPA